MSRVDDLIAEMSPDGVGFRTLDDIGTLYGGLTGKSKADFADGNARFVTYMNVFNNLATDVSPDDVVRIGEHEHQNRVRFGDMLFTASSESAEEVGMASGVTVEPPEPLYLNSFCFGFRPDDAVEFDPEFAKHLFRSEEVRRQIVRTAHGVTRINISKERFRAMRIPLPPLSVQREIAAILDAMRELEAELEAELQARRRQYGHYRDSLLAVAEEDGVQLMALGDVFIMRAGQHISGSQISEIQSIDTPYPCYGGNGIRGYVSSSSHAGDYLLVGRQGALCGNVKRVKGTFYATEHAVVVTPKPGVDVDWAFHMLTFMNLNQYASKSAQPGLAVGKVASVPIALPRLEGQQRIGVILDKFDALVNDLSIGLPAELNARRQQYEYYRDRLLTFSEVA